MKNEKKQMRVQDSGIKTMEVFINLRSDFGFKKVFNDSRMMMSFLNSVIAKKIQKEDFHVTSLTYLPVEHFGENENERRVIVDSRCRINTGEDIVIEMQNARPLNFTNRLIYYENYLIHDQMPLRKRSGTGAKKESVTTKTVRYNMKPVYLIAIVNFPMIKGKSTNKLTIEWIQLISHDTNQVWSDNVNYIVVDLTKFKKTAEELTTLEDYWLYTLKYAETLHERPKTINDELFIELYENILRINKLTPEEMKAYNTSVLDMKNLGLFTDYARMEGEKRGEKRGEARGKIEVVLKAASKGMSIEDIADLTNFSPEQIRKILSEQ
jgi:predicted transposase/invertase (TIGR01784 family)